jgi:hypothetical protein
VSYAAMLGGNPSRNAEFIGVGVPIEGIPAFGLSKVGPNCSLGTSKVPLSGDAFTRYDEEKQALTASGTLTNAAGSCGTFFNSNPIRAPYYNLLGIAVSNQIPYDGVQTTKSQYDAGMSDGKNPTDVSIKKISPVCAIFTTWHGPHGSIRPGGTAVAAAQITPPAGGSATDVYINTNTKVLPLLTQGTILHETLHNLTGLEDFVTTEWRRDYGFQPPYDLKTFVGIETTPGVEPDPTSSTTDITNKLEDQNCAANN